MTFEKAWDGICTGVIVGMYARGIKSIRITCKGDFRERLNNWIDMMDEYVDNDWNEKSRPFRAGNER